MHQNLSVQAQIKLIEKGINDETILERVENADIYFEEDRYLYIQILKTNDIDRAFTIYTNMDTAAREEFISLINHNWLIIRKDD